MVYQSATTYFNQQTNKLYHNLCVKLRPPPNLANLLGLGKKFCLERKRPKIDTSDTINCLKHSIRLRHWLQQANIPPHVNNPTANNANSTPTLSPAYIPNLYIKSEWTPPSIQEGNTETQMMEFATMLRLAAISHHRQRPRSNLSSLQHRQIQTIQNDPRFIVCLTDKNLGPAPLERQQYILWVYQDHLGHDNTYKRLTKFEAIDLLASTSDSLRQAYDTHRDNLPQAKRTYFDQGLQKSHTEYRVPRFYVTPKVHKTPWSTQPVVSCVGSFAEIFSKWLDHQMKKLLPTFSKTYLKDLFAILHDIRNLGPLPPHAKLFTANAVSMYTNIDTLHAMDTFQQWFATYPEEIPSDFPKDLFLLVMEIVMKNNIFQFDNTFWLQLHGTAMGTSTACMYATLYYAYHERLTLLSTFSTKLLYFRRFIDDIFGIWWDARDHTSWSNFQASLLFGSLTWETTK
jgi:hypothetical protein